MKTIFEQKKNEYLPNFNGSPKFQVDSTSQRFMTLSIKQKTKRYQINKK